MKDKALAFLSTGKKTREQLAEHLGLSDREMRRVIEALRADGNRICSDNKSKGYWIAQTDKEYIDFVPQYIGRAYKQLRTLAAMDRKVFNQMEWFGLKNI